MKLNKIFFITIMAALSFSFMACNGEQKSENSDVGSINVTDVRNKTISLEEPAKRVVVLYQGALDGMYMLHAEHTIVGIQHNIYTNEKTFEYFSKLDPRIAGKELATPGNSEASTNMESVVALKPDLVIMQSGQTDAIELLENLGINVFAVSSETKETLYQELENIGKLTGTHARAKELLEYTNDQLEKIKKQTVITGPKKTAYYAWSGGRIFSTSGRKSRMNECFELAGLTNVCTSEVDQPNVNPETLIGWNPDLIFLWSTDPAELYKRKELSVLSAVKNKHVYELDPPFFYDPHTLKIMLAAVELHNIAYAEKGAFDLMQNRKEVMENLYGTKAKALFE